MPEDAWKSGMDTGYMGLSLHYPYGKTAMTKDNILEACKDDWEKKTVAGIVICDRCNSFGKDDAAGLLTLVRGPRKNEEEKLFCPSCITDFDDFMTNGKTEPRDGQAFTEPWKPAENEAEAESAKMVRMVAREFAKAQADLRENPTVDQLLSRIKALESKPNGGTTQKPESD